MRKRSYLPCFFVTRKNNLGKKILCKLKSEGGGRGAGYAKMTNAPGAGWQFLTFVQNN